MRLGRDWSRRSTWSGTSCGTNCTPSSLRPSRLRGDTWQRRSPVPTHRHDARGRGPPGRDRSAVDGGCGDRCADCRGSGPGLGEGRLLASLTTLAAGSPVPVMLSLDPDAKADQQAETALYYVCSEALANTAKHAGATTISVMLRRAGAGSSWSCPTTAGAAPTRGVRSRRAGRPGCGARRPAPGGQSTRSRHRDHRDAARLADLLPGLEQVLGVRPVVSDVVAELEGVS